MRALSLRRAFRTAAVALTNTPTAPIFVTRSGSIFSRRTSSARPGLSAYSARIAAWLALSCEAISPSE